MTDSNSSITFLSQNIITENPLHKDLLEELNDPIIKQFIKLPDDYEKRIGLARSLQFSTWRNNTELMGGWIAAREYNVSDIKNYYYENINNLDSKDMEICFPVIVQNVEPFIICQICNEETFKEIEKPDWGTWSSIYERNEGRIEADLVVFLKILHLP